MAYLMPLSHGTDAGAGEFIVEGGFPWEDAVIVMIELRLLCSVIFDSMKISLWHGGFEMKIRHLGLENVTVFDKIEIAFDEGINIFI